MPFFDVERVSEGVEMKLMAKDFLMKLSKEIETFVLFERERSQSS